jgi:hypothetical protein
MFIWFAHDESIKVNDWTLICNTHPSKQKLGLFDLHAMRVLGLMIEL